MCGDDRVFIWTPAGAVLTALIVYGLLHLSRTLTGSPGDPAAYMAPIAGVSLFLALVSMYAPEEGGEDASALAFVFLFILSVGAGLIYFLGAWTVIALLLIFSLLAVYAELRCWAGW